ncbi:hypothetical protein HBB16_03150 [Pseudonocardia sp. MCCB 268]|nr:hypothetical protein [Pseudonocardia cytotoxica]
MLSIPFVVVCLTLAMRNSSASQFSSIPSSATSIGTRRRRRRRPAARPLWPAAPSRLQRDDLGAGGRETGSTSGSDGHRRR